MKNDVLYHANLSFFDFEVCQASIGRDIVDGGNITKFKTIQYNELIKNKVHETNIQSQVIMILLK